MLLKYRSAALSLALFSSMACGGGDKDAPTAEPTGMDASSTSEAGVDAGPAPDAELDAQTHVDSDSDAGVVPSNTITLADGAVVMLDLYAPDAILDIQIELAPSDWSALTQQGITLADYFTGCVDPDFDYSKYPARVRVDGQQFAQVGVRKKGFLGSLSVRKPSLRLDFDEYINGQTLAGAKTLTLNNGREDPAVIRECLGYQVFNTTGVPASLCSFARVTVNGTVLGIYSNIEPVKKPFLKRVFGENEGNLYEGSLPADFQPELLKNFEKKTNTGDAGVPELEALTAALTVPDEQLIDALSPILDLDQFGRFWASETLLADFDGYDGNQNNFYLYGHPDTGKASFIPWGIDSVFDDSSWTYEGLPVSALANSKLASRLFKLSFGRTFYQKALTDMLSKHWNESALLAEVDRMAALVSPSAEATSLEQLRTFIRDRRANLTADLAKPAMPWPITDYKNPLPLTCQAGMNTPISGTFSTTWLSEGSDVDVPGNTLGSTLAGVMLPPSVKSYALAQPRPGESALTAVTLRIVETAEDGTTLALEFVIGRDDLTVGDVSTHGLETYGTMLLQQPGAAANAPAETLGFVSKATRHFNQAGNHAGDPIVGTFEGTYTSITAP